MSSVNSTDVISETTVDNTVVLASFLTSTDTGTGTDAYTKKSVSADTATDTEVTSLHSYPITTETGTGANPYYVLAYSLHPVGDLENKWTATISNSNTTGQRFEGTVDGQRWIAMVLNDGD
jgi:hypothetical protein